MNFYYFNVNRGKAEPIKFLIRYANLDVKENLFDVADWPGMKNTAKFPLKQVPVLEVFQLQKSSLIKI